MQYYVAPLEGITGYVYRNAHHHFYPGMDRYFTPFLSPKMKKGMNSKEKNDVLPAHNEGISVVPQILSNQSGEFIHLSKTLHDMGYKEINLNLGCPSGTVVSKGKGSGFLKDRDALHHFLEETVQGLENELPDLKLSVKTRLGVEEPEEIIPLMEIYNEYPLSEVIVHARVYRDFYKRPVNWQAFQEGLAISRHSICYNGDLFTLEDYQRFTNTFPMVDKIMPGRGLIANPQLGEEMQKGEKMEFDRKRFFAFHDEILAGYEEIMSGDRNVLFKMKELWSYMGQCFPGQEKIMKKIKKSNDLREYRGTVKALSY